MASFLYFKPNFSRPVISFAELDAWGLRYAFDELPVCRQSSLGKVDEAVVGNGCVFMQQEPKPPIDTSASANGEAANPSKPIKKPRPVGVYPEEQTWKKLPNSDCYVGYYNDNVPTRKDLLRKTSLGSYAFKLNDGDEWEVPRVVHAPEGVAKYDLPCRLDIDDNGNPCDGAPIEKYKYLWELAKPYIDAFLTLDEKAVTELDDNKVLADAISILQVNYRIGPREAVIMDIFTREIRDMPLTLCLLAIDYPTFVAWQEDLKKSEPPPEPAGSDIIDGLKDDTKVIAQLQPT